MIENLTKREFEVLHYALLTEAETAKKLNVKRPTIATINTNLRQKFFVNTKEKALFKALKEGIVKYENVVSE